MRKRKKIEKRLKKYEKMKNNHNKVKFIKK